MMKNWMGWIAILGLAGSASALDPETWVEGVSLEACDTPPTGVALRAFNSLSPDNADLDNDSTFGAAEDGDGDPVYGTIDDAIAGTDPGGIVHLMGRGVHREHSIVVDKSVTIRGGQDADVIVSDDCSSGHTAFQVTITGSQVVVFENLTIRGFNNGITTFGADGGTIVVRNCTIIDNDNAGIVISASVNLRVENSRIINSNTGISGPQKMHVIDSEILRNATAGITAGSAFPWILRNSRIAENGTGVTSIAGAVTIGYMDIEKCQIVENDDDGIYIENASVSLNLIESDVSYNDGHGVRLKGGSISSFNIARSSISGNTDDGVNVDNNQTSCGGTFRGVIADTHIATNGEAGVEIDVGTGTGSCTVPPAPTVTVGLVRNTIINNLGGGITETTAGASVYDCELGHNSLFGNAGINEVNTGGVCTGTGATSNQLN